MEDNRENLINFIIPKSNLKISIEINDFTSKLKEIIPILHQAIGIIPINAHPDIYFFYRGKYLDSDKSFHENDLSNNGMTSEQAILIYLCDPSG